MDRLTQLKRIETTDSFDICVIGGGASGAGVALDATLRGLKVVLIEKNDFGSETSSRSTKLIHGGVRYLEQAVKKLDLGQLKQVKHGLAERRYLLSNAPHLTKVLPIVTPVFHWFSGLYYFLGLKIYALFSRDSMFPTPNWLSKSETLRLIPTLTDDLKSAVIYYDGQLDDARYTLALIQSAEKKGAVALNHAFVDAFVHDAQGRITRVSVIDSLNNRQIQVKARAFVNCTGPYADAIRLLANPEEQPRIRPSKGVHFVLPASFLSSEQAVLIPETKDGRLVFVIPFQGKVLVGTTDTPFENLENEPHLIAEEIDYLLEVIAPYLKEKPQRKDIKSGFGGLRPLIAAKSREGKQTKSLLRDHEVEIDNKSGLISLLGGKWTTYRLMAEDTTNAVIRFLGDTQKSKCQTKQFSLVGAQNHDFDWTRTVEKGRLVGVTESDCNELYSRYGDQIDLLLEVMNENENYMEKLHPDFSYWLGEAVYATRYEMAMTLRDFFARRIRLEILDWQAVIYAIPAVAEAMGRELSWSQAYKQKEIEDYMERIKAFQKAAVSTE